MSCEYAIGYHIGAAFTGKGYATEAVKIFIPFILDKLNVSEIAGICHANNLASRKVLENCGFTLEFEKLGLYQRKIRRIRRYRYIKQN